MREYKALLCKLVHFQKITNSELIKKEGQWIKKTATTMKKFLKMTWTSYNVIYFIKEDRKRNCLNVNFAFFSLKKGARPLYQ